MPRLTIRGIRYKRMNRRNGTNYRKASFLETFDTTALVKILPQNFLLKKNFTHLKDIKKLA